MADVIEVDALTGDVTTRPMTADETAQQEALHAESQEVQGGQVKAVQDAQAELKALGLSDAAIATVSGYPYPYPPTAPAI